MANILTDAQKRYLFELIFYHDGFVPTNAAMATTLSPRERNVLLANDYLHYPGNYRFSVLSVTQRGRRYVRDTLGMKDVRCVS